MKQTCLSLSHCECCCSSLKCTCCSTGDSSSIGMLLSMHLTINMLHNETSQYDYLRRNIHSSLINYDISVHLEFGKNNACILVKLILIYGVQPESARCKTLSDSVWEQMTSLTPMPRDQTSWGFWDFIEYWRLCYLDCKIKTPRSLKEVDIWWFIILDKILKGDKQLLHNIELHKKEFL